MEQKLRITPTLLVPISELQFRFSRSGGAGGQHVNKVSTRVDLLFHVLRSPSLSEHQKALIVNRLRSRIALDGCLMLSSQESRSQWRNRELVVQRFITILSKALKQAAPRIATKSTKASRERRLNKKKLTSRKKESRGKLDID